MNDELLFKNYHEYFYNLKKLLILFKINDNNILIRKIINVYSISFIKFK